MRIEPRLALAIALALPLTARAQDATLEARIAEALRLRTEQRDAEALALLTQAWNDTRSPHALAQMARAEQALGRWLDAERHMTEALASNGDPWIDARREALESERARVREHLGTVEVLGAPPGAEVLIDGRAVGTLPLPAPVWAVAGTSVVDVRSEGFLPVQRRVLVTPGQLARESVSLVAAPSAPPPITPVPVTPVPVTPAPVTPHPREVTDRRGPRVTLAVAGITSGAALVVAGAVAHAVREATVASATDRGCAYDTSGALVGPSDCGDRAATIDLSTALAVTGYVAGGALLAAGVALYLTAPTPTGARVSFACVPSLGVSCALRF